MKKQTSASNQALFDMFDKSEKIQITNFYENWKCVDFRPCDY